MPNHSRLPALLLPASLCATLLLAGCGAIPAPTAPVTVQGVAVRGNVHGGQQPVSNSHVHLLAANIGGYGTTSAQASIDLLTATTLPTDTLNGVTMSYVTTGSDGSFTITGDYTCTAGQVVYALATGGNPGLTPSVDNAAISLIAVLGTCPASGTFLIAHPYLTINEVTTVAATYALSGYLTDAAHLSYDNTPLALTGLQNAAANAANIVDLSSGEALATTPGSSTASITGTVPTQTINSLGNILASCVNSSGIGGPCSTLFGLATSDGTTTGTAPSDTATAMLNIAHNPWANATALYNLSTGFAAFANALGGAPHDWTITISYSESSFDVNRGYPIQGLAIDAAGNAWILVPESQSGSYLLVLNSLGTVLPGEPAQGYTGQGAPGGPNGAIGHAVGIAIDHAGNAWIADSNFNGPSGEVAEATVTASAIKYYNYQDSVLAGNGAVPGGIAIDGSNNVWLTVGSPDSNANSVLEISGSGSSATYTQFTGAAIDYAGAIAIDGAGNPWVTNHSNSVVKITGSAASPTYTTFAGDSLSNLSYIAIDGSNNPWVASNLTDQITQITDTSTTANYINYTGGGLDEPTSFAFDGAGNTWVANTYGDAILEIVGPGTSPTYHSYSSGIPGALAIDGSGDVWAVTANSSVVEMIGAAVPVVTPISAGSSTVAGKLAVRP